MLKVCDAVCLGKRQLISNVSLTRNSVAERVQQLSTNLKDKLVEKGKGFITCFLAVDESTDTSEIAQLSIFIRGVESSLCVTEEKRFWDYVQCMAQPQEKICMNKGVCKRRVGVNPPP